MTTVAEGSDNDAERARSPKGRNPSLVPREDRAPGLRGRRIAVHESAHLRGSRDPRLATAAAGIDAVADGFFARLIQAVRDAVVEAIGTEHGRAPALLDRRGLAHALAVGVDTIDRLRREGCPELTVGDAPRFELEAVLAWLRGRP